MVDADGGPPMAEFFGSSVYVLTTEGCRSDLTMTLAHLAMTVGIVSPQVISKPKVRKDDYGNHGSSGYSAWKILCGCYFTDPVIQDITVTHLQAIRDAYADGSRFALILEDDALFTRPMDQKKIVDWLTTHDWDVFYFGCLQFPPFVTMPVSRNPPIDRCFWPMLAHAYAVSRSGMEKILRDHPVACNEFSRPPLSIDVYLRDLSAKKYMLYPNSCVQSREPALYRRFADDTWILRRLHFDWFHRLVEIVSHYSIPIVIVGWVVLGTTLLLR